MKNSFVYYAGLPENHHLFLKTIKGNMKDVSLLRFDHHCDYNESEDPCMSYVIKAENFFANVFWVNKPDVLKGGFCLYDYHHPQPFPIKIEDVIRDLNKSLKENIVVDVDPDIIAGYKCKDTGLMCVEEMAWIIKALNRNIKYFFFASTKEFAEQAVKACGFEEFSLEEIVA